MVHSSPLRLRSAICPPLRTWLSYRYETACLHFQTRGNGGVASGWQLLFTQFSRDSTVQWRIELTFTFLTHLCASPLSISAIGIMHFCLPSQVYAVMVEVISAALAADTFLIVLSFAPSLKITTAGTSSTLRPRPLPAASCLPMSTLYAAVVPA